MAKSVCGMFINNIESYVCGTRVGTAVVALSTINPRPVTVDPSAVV